MAETWKAGDRIEWQYENTILGTVTAVGDDRIAVLWDDGQRRTYSPDDTCIAPAPSVSERDCRACARNGKSSSCRFCGGSGRVLAVRGGSYAP